MGAEKLVSVVIPCYRGIDYVRGAIESCLNQTYRSVEVIVVDDASPTKDAEVAESFNDPRIRVLRHPVNRGVSEAFNTGFAASNGTYLTRLAQDDLFRNDAFEIMVRKLEESPADVGLVYCDMQMIGIDGQLLVEHHRCEESDRALLPCNRIGNCVMWRREVWDRVGGFRKRYDFSEDYDFYLRILLHYRIEKCRGVEPFFFRWHPAQGSNVFEKRQDVTMCLAQLDYQWSRVKNRPISLSAWKACVGRVARLPGLWLRARLNRPRRSA